VLTELLLQSSRNFMDDLRKNSNARIGRARKRALEGGKLHG
jgi:hypothetical protein